jgi:hypothetical protein
MSKQFVIPASPALARDVSELRSNLNLDAKRAKALYVAIGNQYVDDVVDGLVLGFLNESRGSTPRMRSLVETLAKLIKSIAHGLVGQAFAKLNPETGSVVLEFIDQRLCQRAEGPGLGIPIDPSMVDGIERANVAARESRLASDRASLLTTMKGVIDRSIDYHYKQPFAMLELGFLLRKGVDVGYDAIRSGAMSTIEKSITEADEATLADLAAFLSRRVLPT